MQIQKLLLAGSHAGSTAIAVIEEIKKRNLNYEIHWIGKRFAEEGKTTETLEYKNLSKYGVIFHNLESGKIQTKFTRYTIPALFKIPVGLIKGYKLVKEIKPDLTFSFGSAAGAVSAFWSSYLGIPVVIHEQTATAGRANIISSYFAKKILVARESSLKFFSKKKTEVVGNPLNSEYIKYIGMKPNVRVKSILITGGSRGSTWLNDAIAPILPRLLEKYYILHQTGEANLSKFEYIKDEKYLSFGQTTPKNMAEIIAKADIVISRSGANTVSELIALKKPSILIPIPWTYNDEATENAKYMETLGLARILLQKELTAQKLLSEIEKLIHDYSKIIKVTEDIESEDLQAAEKIVDILASLTHEKK
ncbi:MAG: UDP-N-acetylglucosamine--N-acetylmuramyl-(pentapeptide) pyrophosphoryl-undecaprenol N-acetylglucosamine transferase [Microgenomates group bacterium]